jgi:CRP-like cAMP-binding protein
VIIAALLRLPRSSPWLLPLGPQEVTRLEEVARFLRRADLGRGLSDTQRLRLAGQMEVRRLQPGETLAYAGAPGDELFIVWEGTVEVWAEEKHGRRERMAVLPPGRMTGELAVLDQEPRTADLIAGPEGATVLALSRQRLLSLAEDDAVLGTHLLLNLAMAMSQRARYILWQLEQARRESGRLALEGILLPGKEHPSSGPRPPMM